MPTETTGPVGDLQRIRSLDVLRGFAVLGIFVMNSRNFALPLSQFDNAAFPAAANTPPKAADLWTWGVSNLLFEDKMIAIFSMLFGAGIVMNAERVGGVGRALAAAAVHYRRMFWLLVIGLVHAFGIWYGDILNTYAICGMLLFPVRRLRPGVLVGLGVLVLTVAVWARMGPRAWVVFEATGGPPAAAGGSDQRSSERKESTQDRIWRESGEGEQKACTGSYVDLFKWRAKLNIVWHWYGCINFNFWRCGGFMLIGMGMVSVLSARRSAAVDWGLFIGGLAAGLVLAGFGMWPQLARMLGRAPQASGEARQVLGSIAWVMRYMGAAGLAVGYVGGVLVLCRVGALKWVLAPLAAAGRMALTNYLMQSVVAMIVFDGWALGNWGKWGMAEIAVLVVSVWAVQLVLSPVWLRFFRFGPVEWAWRSLTYWKVQRMGRAAV